MKDFSANDKKQLELGVYPTNQETNSEEYC